MGNKNFLTKINQKLSSLKNISPYRIHKINLVILLLLSAMMLHQNQEIKNFNNHLNYKFPYKSFAKITVSFEVLKSNNKKVPPDLKFSVTGSSIAIDNESNNTILLTAQHVCRPTIFNEIIADKELAIKKFKIKILAIDYFGKEYKGEVIAEDKLKDLCLVRIENCSLKPTKIGKEKPQIGEIVYNVSSPAGFFAPGMVPLLDGRYIGDIYGEKNIINSIYTIPSTNGSSGSPVLNKNGEIIGLIHSALSRYENVSMACSVESLNDFVKKYKFKKRIEKIKNATVKPRRYNNLKMEHY